ncbi:MULTISPECIES: hypothetical protein [Paenibacillus]|uniref:hypothetical protein n=1 Tax=Paenibacillus TaxID=44249 RepID=UPI0015C39814|nr:hypothetical protein [Paenibacillus odorifer]
MTLKKGDWIKFKAGGVGLITRMAKDRSWADVDCGRWSKRVPDPDKHLERIEGQEAYQ